MDEQTKAPEVVLPGEGQRVEALGLTHKVWSEWYAGGLAILEGVIGPGSLIPPHTHAHEDECTFVIEGEVSFDVGGRVSVVSAGAYAIKPRGIPHAIWNAGNGPARVMEIHSPGGFERYYDELGTLLVASMPDDERDRAMEEMRARYGLVAHFDRVPEYVARYGVRL